MPKTKLERERGLRPSDQAGPNSLEFGLHSDSSQTQKDSKLERNMI